MAYLSAIRGSPQEETELERRRQRVHHEGAEDMEVKTSGSTSVLSVSPW